MNNTLNETSVDIVLPNYNSYPYLQETLESIVNQNFKEGLIVCSVHMMYYLVYLFDQLTPFVKDTHLYKQLMYLINKCYEEIIIYITT